MANGVKNDYTSDDLSMKLQDCIYRDTIRVKKNPAVPDIYDVELMHLDRLKQCDSVECHIIVYPYSRKILSRHFEFNPYEEYVNDIIASQKSAYAKIKNSFKNIFGLFLGILITVIFFILKPVDLFTVESIVSVIGAYFVGKELWDDIEDLMIDISKDWRIRYLDRYYYYRLEKNTTLSLYSQLAKKRRYGKAVVLPEKIDFIQKSNSQTIRMFFHMKDLKKLDETSAHILSIRMNSELLTDFEQEGFMFGVKLSFNKRLLGGTRCLEFFQSIDKDLKGCMDAAGEWVNEGIFYRKTFSIGRLKYFMSTGLLGSESLLRAKFL